MTHRELWSHTFFALSQKEKILITKGFSVVVNYKSIMLLTLVLFFWRNEEQRFFNHQMNGSRTYLQGKACHSEDTELG